MKWLDQMRGSYKDTVAPERREKQSIAMKQLQTEGKLPLSSSAIETRVKENEQKELAAKTPAQAITIPALNSKNLIYYPQLVSQLATQWSSPSPFWAGIPEKPRKPLEPELTVVEPVTGWRRWSVDMFGNELRSNNGVRWTPYEKLTAECKAGRVSYNVLTGVGAIDSKSECKGIHCTCGIYAYKTPEDAKFGENAPAKLSSGKVHIWGEVLLWGRVVEHSKGWRGQFAYPKSFVDSGIARQVAAIYGCKVIQDTWEKPKVSAECPPSRCSCPNSFGHVSRFMPDGSEYRMCTLCLWQETIQSATPIHLSRSYFTRPFI